MRFGDGPSVDAEAIELRPRQHTRVLEFHRFDEIDQFMADAHRRNKRRSLAVGPRQASVGSGPRSVPAGDVRERPA